VSPLAELFDLSNISWTDMTWNAWLGCTKVGPECWHCYIAHGGVGFGKRDPWADIYLSKTWAQPYVWNNKLAVNEYMKVFTCSLSDFFHMKIDDRKVPGKGGYLRSQAWDANHDPDFHWRAAAWAVIKNNPNLIFQILTKRPERIADHLPPDWGIGYPNVWLGTSVGCNSTLNRIAHLRRVPVHPSAVRFVSAEPLLEDITQKINLDGIGWLITGGESGFGEEYLWDKNDKNPPKTGRRTMRLEWAYSLMLKCKQSAVPFYFKQITAPKSGQGEDALGMKYHEFPNPPSGGVWWKQPANPLVVMQ
jgi:protein gp37